MPHTWLQIIKYRELELISLSNIKLNLYTAFHQTAALEVELLMIEFTNLCRNETEPVLQDKLSLQQSPATLVHNQISNKCTLHV